RHVARTVTTMVASLGTSRFSTLLGDADCARARRCEATMNQLARLGSFKLPSGEAAMVQMAGTDVRPLIESLQCISERLPLGPRAVSKFELELHLAARDRIATYRARHPCTPVAVRTARLGRWQLPARDRFAGFATNDRLVQHGGPSMARPRTSRGMA